MSIPQGPHTMLLQPPHERIFQAAAAGDVKAMRELYEWYRKIWYILGGENGIAWGVVSKAGSALSDIEIRPHSQLQEVLGTGDRHITANENAEITAIDGLAAGVVAKTANATYAARTIQGTAGEVEIANGDGVSADPTIGLPELISTPRKFGTETDYSEFEEGGTLVFKGDATVWDDVQFDLASGKLGMANNPTWETFTPNTSAYGFAVNDYIDLKADEVPHSWEEGSNGVVHLHLTTKAANATGADRFAKFTAYVGYADINGVWSETSFTAELTIPDGTAALTHKKLTMGTLDLTGYQIGTHIKPRVTRIAATGGTEYAGNIFITQLGIHIEKDTVGSRETTTK